MKDSNLNINALDDATIVKKEEKSAESVAKIRAILIDCSQNICYTYRQKARGVNKQNAET